MLFIIICLKAAVFDGFCVTWILFIADHCMIYGILLGVAIAGIIFALIILALIYKVWSKYHGMCSSTF